MLYRSLMQNKTQATSIKGIQKIKKKHFKFVTRGWFHSFYFTSIEVKLPKQDTLRDDFSLSFFE